MNNELAELLPKVAEVLPEECRYIAIEGEYPYIRLAPKFGFDICISSADSGLDNAQGIAALEQLLIGYAGEVTCRLRKNGATIEVDNKRFNEEGDQAKAICICRAVIEVFGE